MRGTTTPLFFLLKIRLAVQYKDMKTYGESRKDASCEAHTTDRAGGWSGQQSRKVAKRRKTSKKILHRQARRTAKHAL
jgi:hypothetical protein